MHRATLALGIVPVLWRLPIHERAIYNSAYSHATTNDPFGVGTLRLCFEPPFPVDPVQPLLRL